MTLPRSDHVAPLIEDAAKMRWIQNGIPLKERRMSPSGGSRDGGNVSICSFDFLGVGLGSGRMAELPSTLLPLEVSGDWGTRATASNWTRPELNNRILPDCGNEKLA